MIWKFLSAVPYLGISNLLQFRRNLFFVFAAKTGTSTVNVVPIPAGSTVNTVNTPTGVKMIVVSSGMGTGNQTFHIITTTSTPGVQTSTTSSPMTFTIPVSAAGGKSQTFSLATKSLTGGATATLLNAGGGTQLVAVPAQGILPSGAQAFTIAGKPMTVAMTTPQGQTKTVTLVSNQSQIATSQASLINTVTTTQAGEFNDASHQIM